MSSPRALASLGLVLLLTIAGALGLARFELDPDVGSLFPQGHPAVELLRSTRAGQDGARELFLVLEAPELEAELPALVAALRAAPQVARVDGTKAELGGERQRAIEAAPVWYLDAAGLAALEGALGPAARAAAAAEIRSRLATDPVAGRHAAQNDPLGLRWIFVEASERGLPASLSGSSDYLLGASGDVAVVRLTGRPDPFDVDASLALLADIEARLHAVDPDVRMTPIGGYAVAKADSQRIKGDLESSLLWSLPLILIFLTLSTRSWLLPHLILLPVGVAVVWTLGLGGLVFGPLTPLAVSAVAILLGLGVDFTIHFTGRFREERARHAHAEALAITRRSTGRVLASGMLTSGAAFLAVTFGDFPALRELGALLALGLALALLATWLVLPLLLGFVGAAGVREREPFVPQLARGRTGRGLAVVTVALAVAGWGVFAVRGVTFDASPEQLRPADSGLVRAGERLEAELGFSPFGWTVLVDRGVPLAELRAGVDALRAEGVLAFSAGAHRDVLGAQDAGRVAAFRARTAGWAAAAAADLAAGGLKAAAFADGLAAWEARLAADPAGASDAVESPGAPAAPAAAGLVVAPEGALFEWRGQAYWQVELYPAAAPRTRAEREAFAGAIEAALGEVRIVDAGRLGDELAPLLAADLSSTLLACGLVVVLIVVAALRSLRAGLVALAPVACGLGVSLGLFAALGWPLHPGNLLALPLILGLGVDDGLHMVHRARESGAAALGTTGALVWRTTVTTAIGFGSLITAESPAIAALGLVVLVGTVICFLASVVLVPALLAQPDP